MSKIWSSSNKVLVVVSYTNTEALNNYLDALKKLGLNIFECVILAIVDNKEQKKYLFAKGSVIYFSEEEIDFFRRNKNEIVKKVLADTYDLQIVIGDFSKKLKRQIIKTKVKMRIGINTKENFFDINLLSKNETPSHLINFAKEIVDKIS
tara:strand:- start:4985 stop:5434 length:450 start_codon:yes stop_codon:yes gene_type:complete